MELPKGEGWYVKRETIYLAVRVQREKFVFATAWRIDDSTLTLRKLEDFKKEKIAEASKQLGVSKIQRNVTVSALFKTYIEYLRRREAEKGEYVTEERTNSDRVEPQIKSHLEPFFGKILPKDVQPNLMRYRLLRDSEDASASTINGEFRLLRAALRRGWKDNRVRQEHLPKEYPFNYDGEKDAARTGTYTDDQILCILQNATPQFKPLFMTLVFTGLRPKEARWIRREDVLLNDEVPRILVTKHKTAAKTRKPKIVAILDELLPVLKEWEIATQRDYPDCEWFFHIAGQRFDADALETEWDRVRKACGIPTKGVMLYDARRTHSHLLDAHHVSKDDRKTQMGHFTDAMSDAYNKTSIAHVKRIREAFSKGKDEEPATAALSQPEPSKAQPAPFDWKADLEDLKDAFDAGLLPEDVYKNEIAGVMRRRSEMR
jgi:integrase